MSGKAALRKLIDRSEDERSTLHYSTEYLQAIEKRIVANSLVTVKLKMYEWKCKVKIDMRATDLLPSIDVDKL